MRGAADRSMCLLAIIITRYYNGHNSVHHVVAVEHRRCRYPTALPPLQPTALVSGVPPQLPAYSCQSCACLLPCLTHCFVPCAVGEFSIKCVIPALSITSYATMAVTVVALVLMINNLPPDLVHHSLHQHPHQHGLVFPG